MEIIKSKEVTKLIESYPIEAQNQLKKIRHLIFKIATEHEKIEKLEETTKWGEPAYLTPMGSTLRMDWKAKAPDQFALYFQCTSQLIPTFRFVFPDQLTFEGNRAIIFNVKDEMPIDVVEKCIETALVYHKVKKQQNLGL